MRKINDKEYYKFAKNVFNTLHIDSKTFFEEFNEQKKYEVQIFEWINELYLEGKNCEETIQEIHKKRLNILSTIDISPKSKV